jgi:hypothetical protein
MMGLESDRVKIGADCRVEQQHLPFRRKDGTREAATILWIGLVIGGTEHQVEESEAYRRIKGKGSAVTGLSIKDGT